MDSLQDSSRRDIELWRRFSDASPPQAAREVDPNVLAAYIDGTATDGEIEAVEGAMATDPGLVAAVSDLRDLLEGQPEQVTGAVVTRVKAALASELEAEAGAPEKVVRLRFRWGLAAAAAVLLVSVLGFQAGRFDARWHDRADALVVNQLRRELGDDPTEGDLLGAVRPADGPTGSRG